MSAGGRFAVDVDDLDAVVSAMAATERRLEALTDDVERTVRRLQAAWSGRAADAQEVAQREWDRGLRDMRDALRDLRRVGRTAHDGYREAVRANVAMWDQLA